MIEKRQHLIWKKDNVVAKVFYIINYINAYINFLRLVTIMLIMFL